MIGGGTIVTASQSELPAPVARKKSNILSLFRRPAADIQLPQERGRDPRLPKKAVPEANPIAAMAEGIRSLRKSKIIK